MLHLNTWASLTLTKVGFFFSNFFSSPSLHKGCLSSRCHQYDAINITSSCHLQQKHNFQQSLLWIYICWLDPPVTLKRRWSGWVLERVSTPIQPGVGEAVWGVCKEVLVPRWRCTSWCSRDAVKMKQVYLLRVDIHVSTETGLINHRRQKSQVVWPSIDLQPVWGSYPNGLSLRWHSRMECVLRATSAPAFHCLQNRMCPSGNTWCYEEQRTRHRITIKPRGSCQGQTSASRLTICFS